MYRRRVTLGELLPAAPSSPSVPAVRWEPWAVVGLGGGAAALALSDRRSVLAALIGLGTAAAAYYVARREPLAFVVAPDGSAHLVPAHLLPSAVTVPAPAGGGSLLVASLVGPDRATAVVGPATLGPSSPAVVPHPAAPAGFKLSDQMMAKLSQKAVEQLIKFFQTPVETPAPLSPDVAAAWSDYRAGEWSDYSSWVNEQTPPVDVADLEGASNVDALNTVAEAAPESGTAGATAAEAGTTGVESTSIASSTVSNLSTALQVVGVVGALVDIGFTIAGNQPDAQKAVNTALDAAIIVCLFIPVYGWIIALVLGVVKLLLGLFGSSLFGGSQDHLIREMKEVRRTLMTVGGMAAELGDALTPRELVRVLWRWSTGYCGGVSSVAVMGNLVDPAGHSVLIAKHPCLNDRGPYREWADVTAITLDEQALALVKYAGSDFHISIQAGVNPSFLAGPDWSIADGVAKKCAGWAQMMAHGLTLDQIDVVASEHRKEPRLQAIAHFFGYPDWHPLVGWHLQDLWTRYLATNRRGTFTEFAQRLGYTNWVALRDAVAESYGRVMDRATALRDRALAYAGLGAMPYQGVATWLPAGVPDPFAADLPRPASDLEDALAMRLEQLAALVARLEAGCRARQAAIAAAAAASAYASASAGGGGNGG